MRIAFEVGARQQRPIVQAGVVQLVCKNGVAPPGKRGEDSHIRHVTGRKQQRLGQANVVAELLFQLVMCAHMSGHHVGGTRSQAVALQRAHGSFNHFGMVSESQIIVARISHHTLAIDQHGGILRAVDDAARAQLVGLREFGELEREVVNGHGCGASIKTLAPVRLSGRKCLKYRASARVC